MAVDTAPHALCVLVTRPQPQADEWVARLRAQGVQACPLPLMGIDAVADPRAVDDIWRDLLGDTPPAMLVFVSPNAVTQFFARRPAAASWPAGVLAAAPGPGTAQALQAQGVGTSDLEQPDADAPQFDAEALWARLQQRRWIRRRVVIVRGDGGRDWLADTLRAAGAVVDFVAAYRRALPVLDDVQSTLLSRALAEPHAHLWLFSSSEAVGHLRALAPQADWSGAQALASHPRIAEAARSLGFGTVREVRPAFEAVLQAVRAAGA